MLEYYSAMKIKGICYFQQYRSHNQGEWKHDIQSSTLFQSSNLTELIDSI